QPPWREGLSGAAAGSSWRSPRRLALGARACASRRYRFRWGLDPIITPRVEKCLPSGHRSQWACVFAFPPFHYGRVCPQGATNCLVGCGNGHCMAVSRCIGPSKPSKRQVFSVLLDGSLGRLPSVRVGTVHATGQRTVQFLGEILIPTVLLDS